jgi:hypothetical protein
VARDWSDGKALPIQDDRPKAAQASVCWFAPLQLLRTGRHVALATIFGRHGMPHAIEAVAPPHPAGDTGPGPQRAAGSALQAEPPWHDYSGQPTPFWLDYTADTGDGWEATATLAYHLSRPALAFDVPPHGTTVTTHRGHVLVFGGDTVYPTASLENYEARLLLPFRTMFPPQAEEDVKEAPLPPGDTLRLRPDVYAIPGNHDWYDGLVSFTRLFCSKQSFAGWRAPQRRSYFALRLPGGWWLLGTDLQLGSEIDAGQEAFFREVAEEVGEDDRIIICHAEPHWLYETVNPNPYAYRSVQRLEQRFGDRIWVFLSGDLHYYARHESEAGRQKIIAGGGGAFLHLTARQDARQLRPPAPEDSSEPVMSSAPFRRRMIHPSGRTSTWLALSGPLTFHLQNPSFGVATALGYAVAGEALVSPSLAPADPVRLWDEIVVRLFTDPFSLFLVTSIVLGVVFFTDTRSPLYRWSAGTIHALCHVAAAAILARASASLAEAWLHGSLWRYPAVAFGTALGGYAVGPLIVSLYLTVSLLAFGRHRNEASSALRCPDYKNFLRFRIGPDGDLTIFPVGIDRVARRWRRSPGPQTGSTSRAEPEDGSAPRLIEPPLHLPPMSGTPAGSVTRAITGGP